MVHQIAVPAIGLAVTVVLGSWTSSVVKCAVPPPKPFLPSRQEELDRATSLTGYGAECLGRLECIFFFSALWLGQGAPAIGGWLAFKVATKWAAWQHVIRLDRLSEIIKDPVDELRFTNEFGTRLNSKLLIGTLYNILCAVAGYSVAKVVLIHWTHVPGPH